MSATQLPLIPADPAASDPAASDPQLPAILTDVDAESDDDSEEEVPASPAGPPADIEPLPLTPALPTTRSRPPRTTADPDWRDNGPVRGVVQKLGSFPHPSPGTFDKAADLIRTRLAAAKSAGVPSALGACIFAGAFSLGAEFAGFNVAGHLEHTDLQLGTVPSSARWPVAVGDRDAWVKLAASLHSQGLAPDLFYANPPCSAFAKQGRRQGMGDDVMCYTNYVIDVAFALKPKVFVWELVPGVWERDDGHAFVVRLAERLYDEGYQTGVYLTDAALHGGCQRRPRFHFFAWRRDARNVSFPGLAAAAATAANLSELTGRLTATEAVEEALRTGVGRGPTVISHASLAAVDHTALALMARLTSDREVMSGTSLNRLAEVSLAAAPPEWQGSRTLGEVLDAVPIDAPNHLQEQPQGAALLGIMPFVPPGGYLREINENVMWRYYRPRGRVWDGVGRAGVTQVRGRRDRTCPVVAGGPSVIHPEEDRFLTVRENAAAMGFPHDWPFTTPSNRGYPEVGKGLTVHSARAVCSLALAVLVATPAPTPRHVGPEVVDHRPRVDLPAVSCSRPEAREWWARRHPGLPIDWSVPVPKAKNSNKGSQGGQTGREKPAPVPAKPPERVAIAALTTSQAYVKCTASLTKMGINSVSLTTEQSLHDLGAVGAVIVDDTEASIGGASGRAGAVAAALATGYCIGKGLPFIRLSNLSAPHACMAAATALGLTQDEIRNRLLRDIDPLALLMAS